MIHSGKPLISIIGRCSWRNLFDSRLKLGCRETNNLEWYSPDQLTTLNGHLQITLAKTPNHGLDYMGGMMSTWNKFCFTGGIIVTSVVLPGKSSVYGLWVSKRANRLGESVLTISLARHLGNGESRACWLWCFPRWVVALRKCH